ncbi:hypothetical protein TNCV_1467671 [Trichonephila clavipes]|uniref:Uncharacterized protein n=1 Tax=Trichonephila clavipes TaxID=2585209 RepID=A0A8X6VD59_TRICX|nr:hypothetical protein TNCV_1467671 [Trichonephila clavipes]
MKGGLPFDPSYLDLNPAHSLSCLVKTPCKSPVEDAELGTVRVSQNPVERPDIQRSVDVEFGTALVSQQLCELPHAPPVKTFAVRLWKRFVKSSSFLARAILELWERLDLRFRRYICR